MNDRQLRTSEQVKQFMDCSQGIEFNGLNLKEKYRCIEEALRKLKDQWLKIKGKGGKLFAAILELLSRLRMAPG